VAGTPFLKERTKENIPLLSKIPSKNPPLNPLKIKVPALVFFKKETIGGKPL
jgi:hypothetical protein